MSSEKTLHDATQKMAASLCKEEYGDEMQQILTITVVCRGAEQDFMTAGQDATWCLFDSFMQGVAFTLKKVISGEIDLQVLELENKS